MLRILREITNPSFEFCTTTRSEDLGKILICVGGLSEHVSGTSHMCIPHSAAVYLCIYVALGIAKKNEDFIDALYRWAAGPIELLWFSFFSSQLYHHIVVAIPVCILVLASFAESIYWYYLWLIFLGFIGLLVHRLYC